MFSRQWFPEDSQLAINLSVGKLEREFLNNKLNINCLEEEYTNCSHTKKEYIRRIAERLGRIHKKWMSNDNSISILFAGFAESDDSKWLALLHLFQLAYPYKNISFEHFPGTMNREIDLVIYTPFVEFNEVLKRNYSATYVLFLGENVRPRYTEFDYSICCDLSSYDGRNAHLPLWAFELFKISDSTASINIPIIQELETTRHLSIRDRQAAVVYVGNNNEPNRLTCIKLLRENGIRVDCFGKHTRPIASKHEVLKSYVFNLAFENSIYPGYTTEKIIDARLSGCLPIYYGSLDNTFFNWGSCLHYSEEKFESLKENIVQMMHCDELILPPLLKRGGAAKLVNNFVKLIRGFVI